MLVCHDVDAVDTAFFATSILSGKLIGVATLFDFQEKRCRKNLPLSARVIRVHPDRTPAEFVIHVAQLFHRGIICPSETWRQIHDADASSSVTAIFDSLDDAARTLVLDIHRERPESLKFLSATEPDSDFSAMLEWCNANFNG